MSEHETPPDTPAMQPESALDDVSLQDPPVWPKVIGILSICFAGLGIVLGGCGLASIALMPVWQDMLPEELPEVMLPGPGQYMLGAVGFIMSTFLLIAGIMLVMRNPFGRFMHLGYAVVSVPIVGLNMLMQVQQQGAIADWIAQNPDSMFAQSQNPVMSAIGLVLTAVFGLAWPAFLLVWFLAVKRRDEDITGPGLPAAA